MAATKVFTALANGVTLSASSADTVSSVVTMDTHYGAAISIKLTNGGTGPTIAAQVQIEVSHDNSEWYAFGGPVLGSVANSAVFRPGAMDIPIGVEFLRITSGSNTGQDVTLDCDVSSVSVIDA